MKSIEMLCKAEVLSRDGWTETSIKKFLGECDKKTKNPKYRTAAPMCLYIQSRIIEAEGTTEFQQFRIESEERKKCAATAVKTKIGRAVEYARTVTIAMPHLGKDELTQMACDHYNQREQSYQKRKEERDLDRCDAYKDYDENDYTFELASIGSDKKFLDRITFNYVRHVLTNYDRLLRKNFGITGKDEAYEILKERVNGLAAENYDWLEYENSINF